MKKTLMIISGGVVGPSFEAKAAQAGFETKRLSMSVEELSEKDGTFSARAMVFDTLHPTSSWQLGPEWKDRVRSGAFKETLAAHEANGSKPMMLYMHERGNIPGVWTDVRESKGALQVSGRVSPNATTPSGVPLLELMRMGAITGVSIGFKPTQTSLDETKKVRDIHGVDLGEISVVDIPGAPNARITDVKRDKRALEAGLRAMGLSQREAKRLISEGLASLEEGDDEPESLAADYNQLRQAAHEASMRARIATGVANSTGQATDHDAAKAAHEAAAAAHVTAAEALPDPHHDARAVGHGNAENDHMDAAAAHARKGTPGGGDDYHRDDKGRFATKAAGDPEETKATAAGSSASVKANAASNRASKMSDDLRNGIHDAVHPAIKSAAHGLAAKAHEAAAQAHSKAAESHAKTATEADSKGLADKAAEYRAAGVAATGESRMHAQAAAHHQSMADQYARDDHGRFATKAARDEAERKAQWTGAFIDSLPDSAFLYVEPGGKKDADGKTTPRSLRHFPYKGSDGKVDFPHLRNAAARIPQSDLPQAVKDRLATKVSKMLEDAADGGKDDSSEGPDGQRKATLDPVERIRAIAREMKSDETSDDTRRDGARDTARLIVGLAQRIRQEA